MKNDKSLIVLRKILAEKPRSGSSRRVLRAILSDSNHVYRHRLREGDLLLWDNRLLHHGRGWYDNSRTWTIRHCAIADELEPTAIA